MKTYQKIQTVFFKDPHTNHKKLLEGTWAKPEFELLQNIDWVCTEKIDGTNIRIIWDGEIISIRGKTDNAVLPTLLLDKLNDTFTEEKMLKCFPNIKPNSGSEVCIYGEGYGVGIQRGSNYLIDTNDFILFDIKIGRWWLTREAVENIANKLYIKIVPIVGIMTLIDAIEFIRKGYTSSISVNENYIAEGFIMKPVIELSNRNGERVITKLKYKDFVR